MIRLDHLSFRYSEGTQALREVTLEFPTGQFWALLGANGCGKTTLLKLLVGLLKPTSGAILIDGRDLTKLKDKELFSRINLVFQDPNDQLFAATVAQDVAFGPTNLGLSPVEIEARTKEALSEVGLVGLEERPIHTLSYGQKRRAALAGVLAMRPEVILLDEPTSGLDPKGIYAIMSLLRKINRDKGVSIIVATHDVDLVPLFCDQVAIMKKGELLSSGDPEKVFGNETLARSAELRLPRIAHLMEILEKEDGLPFTSRPLTIAGARRELLEVINRSHTSTGEA
ncbi:cobalt/nickel transport system ATP-binding protein [Dehalogenimonas formicexedens]|uniref:ABC transporter ATP-binding protein n=1 Tax=Dehalogenimonas formicexedens TaxID=1839801 RepID=A0A1P8F9J9_9CHLR|nr:ATP-binding cassette domain-containing protein [Dehalogenimonas formicexedens]APV45110.1 cobalt/nickel transport system ATP-binding protein [Dehalogenimonas formicexedens]